MENIESIDVALSSYIEQVRNLATKMEFLENFEFILSDTTKIPWDSLIFSGVYLIEIKNDSKYESFELWLKNFSELWQDPVFKDRFVPGLKKKRIKHHVTLSDWIPLYIGKSRNVGARFKEHLNFDLLRNTFALKLVARKQFLNDTFRLRTIKIQVGNYDQIVPVIENTLRNIINPIIGRQ